MQPLDRSSCGLEPTNNRRAARLRDTSPFRYTTGLWKELFPPAIIQQEQEGRMWAPHTQQGAPARAYHSPLQTEVGSLGGTALGSAGKEQHQVNTHGQLFANIEPRLLTALKINK